MKKIASVSLAIVMLVALPCLAFDFPGHEGQIPLCQNNKTGAVKFAKVKDIDSSEGVDYEPQCNTRFISGTTTPTETLIWVAIQGSQKSSAVKVFDFNNQFLGILLGYVEGIICVPEPVLVAGTYGVIYVPSLAASVQINFDSGEMNDVMCSIETLFFDDDNCVTLSTYQPAGLSSKVIKYGNDYYTGDKVAPSSVPIANVYFGVWSGCTAFASYQSTVPIQKITLPFTLPVALPLRFE